MRIICLIYFLIPVSLLSQNKNRPYSTFGIELNLSRTTLIGNTEKGHRYERPANGGPQLSDWMLLGDVKVNYDYGIHKFLGIGTGFGVSARGGKGLDYFGTTRGTKKIMFHANIPLKIQLKLGFFWLEPALQTNVFLGMYDDTPNRLRPFSLQSSDVKPIYLSGSLAGRFNLFRGLSVSLGWERWLTPIAEMDDTKYYSLGWVLGFRYMFSEPL